MKQIKIYCDICGEEMVIVRGMEPASLKLIGQVDKDGLSVSRIFLKDVCCKCTAKLFGFVDKLQEAGKNAVGN